MVSFIRHAIQLLLFCVMRAFTLVFDDGAQKHLLQAHFVEILKRLLKVSIS